MQRRGSLQGDPFFVLPKFIILTDNNLEVFMKRLFLGMFLAIVALGIVGCTTYAESDDEDLHEKCLKEPNLPVCQENKDDDEKEETGDTPSLEEEF